MKKFFPALLLFLFFSRVYSQPNEGSTIKTESTSVTQKFFFSSNLYKDSMALNTAIPKLAEEVLKVYNETDRRKYFENASNCYLLTGNYQKAIEMVDSIQKADENKSYGIEIKSFVIAKVIEKKEKVSFSETFKKDFAVAFDKLTFHQKVSTAYLDTNALNYFKTEYKEIKEELQKNEADSLKLDDALSLVNKFFRYTFYTDLFPLMSAQLNDPRYKQQYPAISKWGGVVPVEKIDEVADPHIKYKLLFELTGFAMKGQDSTAKKEINMGLWEVARQLNLHEAAGVPRKNIDAVIVAHAGVINAFLINEKYKKKYKVDNPNIEIIKALQDYGVKFIVCGQAMTFLNKEMEDLVPGIKQALTAQTVISSYQLKGYVYYDLSLRE